MMTTSALVIAPLGASTPTTLHCNDLLGIPLHIHNDAKERSHHFFPGLIAVKHRTVRVGIELVVERVVEVSVDCHLAPLGHLDVGVVTELPVKVVVRHAQNN